MATLTRPTPKRKSQRSGQHCRHRGDLRRAGDPRADLPAAFYLIVRASLSSEADLTSPHWTFFSDDAAWSNFKELFTDIR